jgi:hypothetical protein
MSLNAVDMIVHTNEVRYAIITSIDHSGSDGFCIGVGCDPDDGLRRMRSDCVRIS